MVRVRAMGAMGNPPCADADSDQQNTPFRLSSLRIQLRDPLKTKSRNLQPRVGTPFVGTPRKTPGTPKISSKTKAGRKLQLRVETGLKPPTKTGWLQLSPIADDSDVDITDSPRKRTGWLQLSPIADDSEVDITDSPRKKTGWPQLNPIADDSDVDITDSLIRQTGRLRLGPIAEPPLLESPTRSPKRKTRGKLQLRVDTGSSKAKISRGLQLRVTTPKDSLKTKTPRVLQLRVGSPILASPPGSRRRGMPGSARKMRWGDVPPFNKNEKEVLMSPKRTKQRPVFSYGSPVPPPGRSAAAPDAPRMAQKHVRFTMEELREMREGMMPHKESPFGLFAEEGSPTKNNLVSKTQ